MTEQPTDEQEVPSAGPNFDDPEMVKSLIEAFCETHHVSKSDLSPHARDLIIARLRVIHEARGLFEEAQRLTHGMAPNPPGQLDYLTFMLDRICPPGTEERLTFDLEFAELNLRMARELVDAVKDGMKPKLVIPGVGTTQAINNSKD